MRYIDRKHGLQRLALLSFTRPQKTGADEMMELGGDATEALGAVGDAAAREANQSAAASSSSTPSVALEMDKKGARRRCSCSMRPTSRLSARLLLQTDSTRRRPAVC